MASDESFRRMLKQLSPDFKQLTLKEVQDMKWSLRKNIILVLFSASPSVFTQLEEMEHLVEYRQKALAAEKRAVANGTLDADERKEAEINHRTQLLRICISGLTVLRWPPAIAAFADPLQDLLHDKTVFMEAMLYMHRIAVPANTSNSVEAYLNEHSSPAPSATTRVTHSASGHKIDYSYSADGGRQNAAADTSFSSDEGMAPSSIGNASAHTRHSREGSSNYDEHGDRGGFPVSMLDMSTLTDAASGIHGSGGSPSKREGGGTARSAMNTSRPNGNGTGRSTARPGRTDGAANYATPEQATPDKAALLAILKVMQHQNEMLGRQLRSLHAANKRRDDAEMRVDTILLDVLGAVQEAASIGGDGDSGGGGTSNKDNNFIGSVMSSVKENPYLSADSSVVTDDEDRAFRQEVEREARLKRSAAPANSGYGKGVSTGRVVRGTTTQLDAGAGSGNSSNTGKRVTSGLIWKQVYARIKQLQAQWVDSRAEARSSYIHFCEEQRNLRKQDQAHSAMMGGGSSISSSGTGGLGSSRQSTALNRTLGVSSKLGLLNSHNSSCAHFDSDEHGEVFLDLSRTHLLQRDLVEFATAAYRVLHPEEVDEGARGGSVGGGGASLASATSTASSRWGDPLPTSRSSVGSADALTVLQRRAQELALHLASHASQAPLSVAGTSTSTGLDAFIAAAEELAVSSNLRKRDVRSWERLQAVCEHAKNEYQTLNHCLQQAFKQQKKQKAASRVLAPLMEQFSTNAQKILRGALAPLQPALQALTTVMSSLAEAEKASIVDKSGSRVQPCDMLARGYLGEPVSNMIQALRLHRSDLTELETTLRELHKNVHQAALSELMSFTSAKEKVFESLEAAGISAFSGDMASEISTRTPRAGEVVIVPGVRPPRNGIKSTPPKIPSHQIDRDGPGPDWGEMAYQQAQKANASANMSGKKSPIERGNGAKAQSRSNVQPRPAFNNSVSQSPR